MNILSAVGVIAEYNPFHNGHIFHLNESKRVTSRSHAVAVMSGNFVQRGEPALCDKWQRTRMALTHGAGIVIELPVFYAAAGTEHFARAAVKLLNATGVVDCLCFGSECGDIGSIQAAAHILANEPLGFKETLRRNLAEGLSFPAARACALTRMMDTTAGLLTLPNNGLGIEYCKALFTLKAQIIPYTIVRAAPSGVFKSASTIRRELFNGQLQEASEALPADAYELLCKLAANGEAASLEGFGDMFQYVIRVLDETSLCEITDMTPALAARFRRYAGRHRVLHDLLSAVKSRCYTYTRLQRSVLHTVLGITRKLSEECAVDEGPHYIRVLGFRRDSVSLLKELTKQAALPVVTNIKNAPDVLRCTALKMLRKEIETTDLYFLSGKKNIHDLHYEYHMPLIIV
jgi:predicted nucleotidyltransferase